MPFVELGLGYHARAHAPWVLDSGYHAQDLFIRAPTIYWAQAW